MPTLLLANGLQAACLLGWCDTLLALGTAAAMNAVGDVILVVGLAASGAAAATVVDHSGRRFFCGQLDKAADAATEQLGNDTMALAFAGKCDVG